MTNNAELLLRIGKGTKEMLLATVKERRMNYPEHVTKGRKYELLKLVHKGKICRKLQLGDGKCKSKFCIVGCPLGNFQGCGCFNPASS